ncbi:hypothetical protein LTR56_013811 [Elasticomyces elasticus]|nr:hypothetical protein LTR56_013811 [Elasticomyces elasticus]KAK3660584.1 hypothetical protein LTR22_008026 [Elasticomyces elasticus]KAK4923803.1 hypothetical protein LTR49_008950 [Elasticomyces elasticus]KAK5752014.1 hypothetical protein LTS12_017948 [Elasticomyces elasticus]
MDSMISTVQTTLSQNLGGAAHGLAPADQQFSLDQVPDQSGKVAVVTGGSEGIGYGCTHTLLNKNIKKLFILSLSKEVVDGAKKAIAEELGQDKADRTEWIQCDLTDWKKVTEVAKQITDSTDRLDILINNAARGIMTYQLTDQNLDLHMALNHFGHVTLTSHLLPLLKKTAEKGHKVRICTMASNAHQNAPKDVKFASLDELNTDLGPNGQYGRSKLANLLYARYLGRHLTPEYPNILSNATHPGVVETKQTEEYIHEAYPLAGYMMSVGMRPFRKSQFEGCVSMMFAATTTEKTGQYICPQAAIETGSELAQDEALGEQLMKLTREIMTEKTRKDSVDKGCPMKDY